MGTLVVAVINVIFILFVYTVFSRKLRALEKRRLPDELRQEIGGLITDFNQTAATNVSLLEDRISRLQPLVRDAASRVDELEGQLARAQLLLNDLRRPATENSPQSPNVPKKGVKRTVSSPMASSQDSIVRKRALASYAEEGLSGRDDKESEAKKAGKGKNSAAVKKAAGRKKGGSKTRDRLSVKINKLRKSGASAEEIALDTGLSLQQVEMRIAFDSHRDARDEG